MGLSIGQRTSIKFRILPTLIMAFALVAQPLYGFVSSQVVDAVSPTTVHTTDLSTWDLRDTGTTGNNQLVANGLHVWTQGATSTDKAAGYYKTPGLNLQDVNSASIDFASYAPGFGRPGLQLSVDRDGDGIFDGNLVYEPWAYGDGNWWVNKPGFNVAPGSGYMSMGTLADYQAANPAAKIQAIGYSLGSGVKGDAVISKITIGNTIYTFGLAPLDYSNVYVSPTGVDTNNGTSLATPFKTIQKALNTVAENGTVHLSAGSFPQEQLTVVKNGTKLIGQGRDATRITVLKNASGQGLLAEGLDNITIKSLGVIGSSDNAGASGNALIKLANGKNGIIENVIAGSSSTLQTKATGIDINGYANVRIDNVFVYGLGKDGISITAKSPNQTYNTDNIRIQGAAVSSVAWSAIAFYTSAGNENTGYTPIGDITNVSFGGTSTLQGNDQGIYFDGLTGKTTTGLNGQLVKTDGVVLKDSRKNFIDNAQTVGVNAVTTSFDIGGNVNRPATSLDATQLATVNAKIIDRADKPQNGVVYLQGPKQPVLTNTTTYVNGSVNAKSVSWTNNNESVAKFEYLQYNSLADKEAGIVAYKELHDGTKYSTDVAGSWSSATFYYQIVAIDAAGNRSVASDFGTVIVDREAPQGSIRYGNTAPINGNVIAYLTTNEPIVTPVGWTSVGGSSSNFSKKYTQNKTEVVSFKDLAGNAGSANVLISWIDKVNPQVISTEYSNNGQVTNQDVTIKITFNESVTINVEGWSAANSDKKVWEKTVSSNGSGNVEAKDQAGNPVSVNYSVTGIDKSVPEITLTGTKYSDEVYKSSVGYSVSDNAGLTVAVNGIPASQQGTLTQDGVYTITATDTAENRITRTFTIDTKGPILVTSNLTPNADGSYTLSGTVSEGSNVYVSIDGGAPILATRNGINWTLVINGLSAANHTFTTTSLDEYGNVTTSNFQRDLTPVVNTVVSPVSNTGTLSAVTGVTSRTLLVNGSAQVATNGEDTQNSIADTEGEVLGTRDNKSTDKIAAISPSEQGWKIFGFAWYWWLLILAAIAAIWWAIAGYRRRNNEQA